MGERLEIPKHWKYISLVEDLNYVPTGVEPYEGEKPYYSTGSIKEKEHIPEGMYIFSDRPSRANRLVQKNDVLQARMKGTNKALLIDDQLDGALFSTGFFQVRPYGDTYVPKFLYFYLGSSVFLKEKDALCSGSTQSALNDTNAKKIKIPLPPIEEQNRIVAKIETLFSELDKSIESLKRAKQKLALYRQSVLKAAFEGELTKAWREAHKDELEDAETLLERIKKEREANYEKRLDEWKEVVKAWEENGKQGKKPTKPKKPKELPPITEEELRELPDLPDGWKWVLLNHISEISGGLTKSSIRNSLKNKVPFLRVANVYENRLDLKDIHYIGIKDEELQRVLLEKNDLLFVEGNGSIDQIGRLAIWDGSIKNCVHQNHLIKVRSSKKVKPKYILYFFISGKGKELVKEKANSTSGLFTLNLTKINNLYIPLCSTLEQNQIIKEIESRFSEVDALEKSIDEGIRKSEMMRQSVLKQAFEGRLINNEGVDIA